MRDYGLSYMSRPIVKEPVWDNILWSSVRHDHMSSNTMRSSKSVSYGMVSSVWSDSNSTVLGVLFERLGRWEPVGMRPQRVCSVGRFSSSSLSSARAGMSGSVIWDMVSSGSSFWMGSRGSCELLGGLGGGGAASAFSRCAPSALRL